MVHPVLRDETNAMAATRTPEKCPEVSENGPSGIRKVHPKIGYLDVTDYINTFPYIIRLLRSAAGPNEATVMAITSPEWGLGAR